jgi:hypothetical protein
MVRYLAILLAIAISFLFGLKFDSFRASAPVEAVTDTFYQTKYENLKKQIEQIHAVDFEEYQNLKEQKAKYEKADEILGKIFLIFLAEAGLKLSTKEVSELKQATKNKTVEPIMMADDHFAAEPQKKESPIAKKSEMDWIKNEKVFPTLKGAKEIEDQLSATEIKDLFSVLKQSKTITADVAQKINGSFEGQVSLDSAPYAWLLEVDFEVTGVSGPTDYAVKYAIRASDLNKEPFSNSHGDGNPDVFLMTDKSQAIFLKIRAKGKENYMQLYLIDNDRKLVGNYYEAISLDQYKKAGTVALTKK